MKSSTKNVLLNFALLTSIAATGILTYLTLHFYDLKYGATSGGSICNINEVLNCDAVAASKYSSFLGLPIALWGASTFLVLVYFLLVSRFNLVQDKEKTSRYAFLLSCVTVLTSIVMGLISSQMSNLCLFCMATYALSALTAAQLYFASSKPKPSLLIDDLKDIFVIERWVLGFAIFIPVFAFVANLMYLESNGFSQIDKIAAEKVTYWNAAPAQNFVPGAGLEMFHGNGEPVMTIIEFADFRCPHCKHAAPSIHSFVKNHPDVKFIFKPFPLDGTCNEAIPGGDGISCGLAAAVMCAEKTQQKGWEAHDYFFENQENVLRTNNLDESVKQMVEAEKINADTLKTCMQDPSTMENIRAMAKEGATAQIRGTPTVFVNNKVLEGGQLVPVLQAAYQTLKK